MADVNGQIIQCYQVWGVYNEFAAVKDNFTGILGLPQAWIWKYPGAIEAAWSIKQNGANQRDVKRLLGAIGECPYSTVNGKVQLQGDYVKIQDNLFKVKEQGLFNRELLQKKM